MYNETGIQKVYGSRIGRFRIDERVISLTEKEIIKQILVNVFITRCEYFWHGGYFEYYAFSDLFDEAKEGEPVPQYQITIKEEDCELDNKTPKYSVKFERIK